MRARSVRPGALLLLSVAIAPSLAGGQETKRRAHWPDLAEGFDPYQAGTNVRLAGPRPIKPRFESVPATVPVRVVGIVTDVDHRPVAGATVDALSIRYPTGEEIRGEWALIGTATTGADGTYRIVDVPAPVRHDVGSGMMETPYVEVAVAARAPRFGVGWRRPMGMYATPIIDPDDVAGRLPLGEPMVRDIHLRPAARLGGRVVDASGQPVAGVAVETIEVRLRDEDGHDADRALDGPYPGLGRASTDADGRFRLEGLPRDSCCRIGFRVPGSSSSAIRHVSTSAGGVEAHREGSGRHTEFTPHQALPAEMAVALPSTRRVDARLVGADDGRPVAGTRVRLTSRLANPTMPDATLAVDAIADADGRLGLDLPPGRYDRLFTFPSRRGSRFPRENLPPLVVPDAPGATSIVWRLRPGTILVLEVVDAATGKGVPDIQFRVRPTAENGVRFSSEPLASWSVGGGVAQTDADGRARATIEAEPGAGSLISLVNPNEEAGPNAAPPSPVTIRNAYRVVGPPERRFDRDPGAEIRVRFEVRRADGRP